ncbi:MAG: PIN domain-containing protein [Xanthobacteraceae bacterium]|jgi:predicted nucleic acid-binding protein
MGQGSPAPAKIGPDARFFMANGKTNCFVDTNLLIYAMDRTDPAKHGRAAGLLKRIVSEHTLLLSPQSLNEFYHVVAVRRRIASAAEARGFVWSLSEFCNAPYDFTTTQLAWAIADRHRLSWWDCTLLASALLAGCDLFLSEDMQHEYEIERMTILNPFKLAPNFELSR